MAVNTYTPYTIAVLILLSVLVDTSGYRKTNYKHVIT